MRLPQLEIRVGVVEDFCIELDDVSIAPQMITVATAALLLCSIGPAAVISLSCRAVCGNVLVTVKAKIGLRLAGEWFVALAAILLELGVPLRDRPRKDQLFKQILRAYARRQRCYKNTYNSHSYKSSGQPRRSNTQKRCTAKT